MDDLVARRSRRQSRLLQRQLQGRARRLRQGKNSARAAAQWRHRCFRLRGRIHRRELQRRRRSSLHRVADCPRRAMAAMREYARLESKWTIPLPRVCRCAKRWFIGTAGFTAALSLYQHEAKRADAGDGADRRHRRDGRCRLARDRYSHAGRIRSARDQRQDRALRRFDRSRRQAMHLDAKICTGANARWKRASGRARSTTSAATCSPV